MSEPHQSSAAVGFEKPTVQLKAISSCPTLSVQNTMAARYAAAVLDNVLAMVLGIVSAKAIGGQLVVQTGVLVCAYLGYFLMLEGLTSRTIGKWFTGLWVVQFDGTRCSWGQAALRTLFRVLEVNPILLGYLPAALCIVFSSRRQRLGDMAAHTLVVNSSPRRP